MPCVWVLISKVELWRTLHITSLCFCLQILKCSNSFQNQLGNCKCVIESAFLSSMCLQKTSELQKAIALLCPKESGFRNLTLWKPWQHQCDWHWAWAKGSIPLQIKYKAFLSTSSRRKTQWWPRLIPWHSVVNTKASTLCGGGGVIHDVPCTTEYVCECITDIYMYMHICVGRETVWKKGEIIFTLIILADDGIPLADWVRKWQWYQHIFVTLSKETWIKLI